MKRALAGAVALAAVLTGAVACNDANSKDVKGVQANANPGNITAFANIDQQPNFARVCADGLAFITTSRDAMPINRIPEWDWACPKPPGFQSSKTATNLLGDQPAVIVHQDAG